MMETAFRSDVNSETV